jgi:hypothetical protein
MNALSLCQKLTLVALLLECAEMLYLRKRIAQVFLERKKLVLTPLLLTLAAFSIVTLWDPRAFAVVLLIKLFLIVKLRGPYAGASDAMLLQILLTLTGVALFPEYERWFFVYLGIQVTLSLFLSGIHKTFHSQWWSGKALGRALRLETLDIPKRLQALSRSRRLTQALSAILLTFELSFPIVVFAPDLRAPYVALALCFHVLNAYAFGLNRFFWVWLAAYPALFALPHR